MKALTFALLACAVVLTISASANGALLGLIPQTPDIAAGLLSVNYDALSDGLSVVGSAMTLDDDGIGDALEITMFTGMSGVPGIYDLSATIDGSGALVGGSLTVSGYVDALGYSSGTILTGDLTDLGYDEVFGSQIEFKFVVTGGDAAALYGNGSIGGIIMGVFSLDFNGSFAGSWSNFGSDSSDNFFVEVPEPATMGLLALGLGLVARKRRS